MRCVTLVPGDRVWDKFLTGEITREKEGAVFFRLFPGKYKKGLFGLEITDLQCAVDLCMEGRAVERKYEFWLRENEVFHPLVVVEVRESVQSELFRFG